MPGLINIGAGLSAAGGAIAQTAGEAGMLAQKQQLEEQSMRLASDLATTRETTLEAQRQAGAQTLQQAGFTQQTNERVAAQNFKVGPEADAAKDLAQYTSNLAVEANNQEALNTLNRLPLMQKTQRQGDIDAANDSQWVNAQRVMKSVTATPAERAQAQMYLSEAAKNAIQTTALTEAQKARDDLGVALRSGDQDAIHDAQSRLMVAEYSSHDEVARASALAQAAQRAQLSMNSIQAELARQRAEITGAVTPDQQKNITDLQTQLEQATADYKIYNAQATDAARNLPSFSSVLGGGAATPKVGPGSSRDNPVRPQTKQDAAALPKGTWFVDPSGSLIQRQ